MYFFYYLKKKIAAIFNFTIKTLVDAKNKQV